MLSIKQTESRLIVKQIPILLFVLSGILTLPMLIYGLFNTIRQTGVDGSIFGIIWGLGMGWVMFDFVATREEIVIDRMSGDFWRIVKGIFRVKKQHIRLSVVTSITLETKRDLRGRSRRYLYLRGADNELLINNPSILYINHYKMGKILSEFMSLPLQTTLAM